MESIFVKAGGGQILNTFVTEIQIIIGLSGFHIAGATKDQFFAEMVQG